jgi:hypothetical protein
MLNYYFSNRISKKKAAQITERLFLLRILKLLDHLLIQRFKNIYSSTVGASAASEISGRSINST